MADQAVVLNATAYHPPKRSAVVILTAAAAMGMAAHAQQSTDPCEGASFNGKVCQAAVRHGGYCAGGTWIPRIYQQRYPDYYDKYQSYLSGGGVATAVPEEKCRRPFHSIFGSHRVSYGGFGAIGSGHPAGG